MAVLFRRIRGRAAGHVISVNPLNVRCLEPTSWGGTEINFSDVHSIVSRDNPAVVQQLLEGRVRLCSTPLCDRDTDDVYAPLCERCRARTVNFPAGAVQEQKVTVEPDTLPLAEVSEKCQDLVIVGGRHGFA